MRSERRHDQLQARAGEQWGILTRDQIRAAGFSESQIRRLIADGVLHRRFRGVYSYGTDRPAVKGVLLAAQWSVGEEAYLTGRTSLGLIKICGQFLGRIEVAVATRTVRARQPPIRLMRCGHPADPLHRDGPLRYSNVEGALLDLSTHGASPSQLARLITDAVHVRRLDHARMRHELAEHAGLPGTLALSRAYANYLPKPAGKSGLERSVSQGLAERPWLPESIPNHHVEAAGVSWEIDRYFPAEKVALELHGGGFHHAETDLEKDSFKAVKLALIGIQTVVITDTRWELEPERCLDDLEQMLALRGWRHAA